MREGDHGLARRGRLGRDRLVEGVGEDRSARRSARLLSLASITRHGAQRVSVCANRSWSAAVVRSRSSRVGGAAASARWRRHGSSCRSRSRCCCSSAEMWKNSLMISVPWSRCWASNSLTSSQARDQRLPSISPAGALLDQPPIPAAIEDRRVPGGGSALQNGASQWRSSLPLSLPPTQRVAMWHGSHEPTSRLSAAFLPAPAQPSKMIRARLRWTICATCAWASRSCKRGQRGR